MHLKFIFLLLLTHSIVACRFSVNNNQEQINNRMENQSIVFNIHTFDEKVSKIPPAEEKDRIITKVIELFSESEPTRRFFEEGELKELLENTEGFDIIFEPYLSLSGSENKLSKVHFFTAGEMANSSEIEDVTFLVALDGECLNNPFIAYNFRHIYTYLEELAFE